ncbi:MAG: hypothetical protein REI09_13525 [Candidatus Dactylopiibacterium sp.]|nr:hypothetical protein [Candidatus Dactylopiibacterium sp.]
MSQVRFGTHFDTRGDVRLNTADVMFAARRAAWVLLVPAIFFGACLLALVGERFRQMEQTPGETMDASRQVLYVAQQDGAVRVLQLRNTVSELGVMREPGRHAIHTLALDASGRQLRVEGDDATYHYDAVSLKLLERKPALHEEAANTDSLSPADPHLRRVSFN